MAGGAIDVGRQIAVVAAMRNARVMSATALRLLDSDPSIQRSRRYFAGLMTISTRRFSWRPWSVALDATGRLAPSPVAAIVRPFNSGCAIKNVRTAWAHVVGVTLDQD